MAKSKSRSHAAKQGKSRRSRRSGGPCQAPVTGSTNLPGKRFCVKEITEPSPHNGRGTDHDLPVEQGLKTRKRNSRRAKKILAGSNHRELAATSLKRRGKTADKAVCKRKKKKVGHKTKKMVEKSPTDYGDDRRTMVVYTDGACSFNGKCNAAAGIGVWWDSGDERNLSERCPGLQTNTRAEIFAAVRLLEEAPMIGRKGRLVIRTDSKYVINCAINWGPRWENQGWTTASGDKVKDIGIIRYFLALLSLRATRGEAIVFEHVRGHSNSVGNDGADSLAKRGTTEPVIPERDWRARRQLVEAIEAKLILFEVVEE